MNHVTKLFDLCRLAEVVCAVCLTAARKTIKLRITGYSGNLIMHSVTAEHTEMSVMVGTTTAFDLVFHEHLTLCFYDIKPVKLFPS
jgi:hypothetical protein